MKINPKLKEALEWTYCIVIAITLALLFRYYVGTPTVVRMTSMYSTIEPGERLLLNRWVRTVDGTYNRGDIITFERPSNPAPTAQEVNMNNPVAQYEYTPKGVINK